MAREMWLPGLQAATANVDSDQLKQVVRQTAAALGGDCRMMSAHGSNFIGADVHLIGIARNNILIGVYEMEDYADGVLFKRVCDGPVRELIRLGKLPTPPEWPSNYEPVNRFGGSKKLPSRCSVADMMDMG